MAVTITATTEPSQARVAIKAEGGVIGSAFFIGRRGRDGVLGLVRETSESSKLWIRDPAGQRSNLFTRPRFEVSSAAARIFTNSFRNPDLVADPAVANVVRTNLAANPGFEEIVRFQAEFGTGGAGTTELSTNRPFTGSQFIRTRWTKKGLYGGVFANTFDVVPGRDYTVSVYVRTSVLKRMRIVMGWNGSTVQNLGPDTVVSAYSTSNTGWTRLVWQGKAPTGAVSGVPYMFLTEGYGQVWNANEWMDIDGMLIEVGTVLRDYFDGSFGPTESETEGQLLSAWTDEANRSSSVMYPASVLATTGEQANIRRYGDAAAIIPTGSSTASAVLLDHGNSMVAGKTYTIAALISVLTRSGTLNANAGSITVTSKNSAGTIISTQKTLAVAVGSTNAYVYQSFTIPALTTAVEVRIVNGASTGKGITTFKQVRIVEGNFDPGFFSGATANKTDLEYVWVSPTVYSYGTIGASALQALQSAGITGTNASPIYSKIWKKNGTAALRIFPTSSGTDSYVIAPAAVVALAAGKTYTFIGTQRQGTKLTGSLHADSRKVRVTGTGMTALTSSQPANTANRVTTLRWTFTVPTGATNVRMEFVHGGVFDSGDLYWDEVLVTEGEYTGSYFDGEFGNTTIGGWNGTKDASTSYRYGDSLPIMVYDYEARQGQTVEYFVLDGNGMPVTDTPATVKIPEWGTWLKDPFRPHLNLKVWFNSDDAYTRQANRVLLQPRGSRLPIAQWERRSAPEGVLRFLTETHDDARRLTTLIDETGVLFLDVAEDFGVPFRYASIGDVSGRRAVEGALRDPHRYWDFEAQEVAVPVGEPSTMTVTYENLLTKFASYLELRNTVDDYKDVASGEWNR